MAATAAMVAAGKTVAFAGTEAWGAWKGAWAARVALEELKAAMELRAALAVACPAATVDVGAPWHSMMWSCCQRGVVS